MLPLRRRTSRAPVRVDGRVEVAVEYDTVQKIDGSNRWAIGTAWGLGIAGTLSLVSALQSLAVIGALSWARAFSGSGLRSTVTVLSLVAELATAVYFVAWMRRAYDTVGKLSQAPQDFTDAEVLWAFFIPVINVIRPYQIVAKIWRGRDEARASWLIGAWWCAWTFGSFIGFKSTSVDTQHGRAALGLAAIGALLSAISALFAVSMVREIDRDQRRWAAEAPPAEIRPPSAFVGGLPTAPQTAHIEPATTPPNYTAAMVPGSVRSEPMQPAPAAPMSARPRPRTGAGPVLPSGIQSARLKPERAWSPAVLISTVALLLLPVGGAFGYIAWREAAVAEVVQTLRTRLSDGTPFEDDDLNLKTVQAEIDTALAAVGGDANHYTMEIYIQTEAEAVRAERRRALSMTASLKRSWPKRLADGGICFRLHLEGQVDTLWSSTPIELTIWTNVAPTGFESFTEDGALLDFEPQRHD